MTLKSTIKDGKGTNNLAGVSTAGELILKGFGDNQSSNQHINAINTAFNFFPPLPNQTFIITTLITALPNNSSITIFSAPSATSTKIDTELLTIGIINAVTLNISFPFGGFLSVGEGEFLNATVNIQPSDTTIIGFYVPV